MKRTLVIFAVALTFIVALAFLIASKRPAPVTDLPLPNPNGYDKFIQAGKMLQGDAGVFETMSQTDLAAVVAANVESLALVRSAFTNQCRVPVQYSLSYLSAHLNDLTTLRNLSQAMMAEGRLAELENHPGEAARDYLDVIRLGMESGRGGFITDALIGNAIEKIGQNHLRNLVNSLDAASCRATASTLESLESNRPSWDDILQKEDTLIRRLSPGSQTIFVDLFMHIQLSDSRKKLEKTFHSTQTETRNLAVQFAARAYELDKSKPPTSITDLVPAYLKAVPKDATTGKDMVYFPR